MFWVGGRWLELWRSLYYASDASPLLPLLLCLIVAARRAALTNAASTSTAADATTLRASLRAAGWLARRTTVGVALRRKRVTGGGCRNERVGNACAAPGKQHSYRQLMALPRLGRRITYGARTPAYAAGAAWRKFDCGDARTHRHAAYVAAALRHLGGAAAAPRARALPSVYCLFFAAGGICGMRGFCDAVRAASAKPGGSALPLYQHHTARTALFGSSGDGGGTFEGGTFLLLRRQQAACRGAEHGIPLREQHGVAACWLRAEHAGATAAA